MTEHRAPRRRIHWAAAIVAGVVGLGGLLLFCYGHGPVRGFGGDVLIVVSKSKAMGDLPMVVELVKGGVEAIRENVPDSLQRALNRALFLGGVTSIDGLDTSRIGEWNIASVMPKSSQIAAMTLLMSRWYVNAGEEASIVAILKAASSPSAILSAADTTSGKVYKRLTGSNADAVAALFGGTAKLQYIGGNGPALQRTVDEGFSGPSRTLPHMDAIQASFGRHDVSGIRAHTGAAAAQASGELGASAFASGSNIAFGSEPDLHTIAHEAAHTVQQKAGVQLAGGAGRTGDAHERHADAVADRVVQGKSAEGLLDQYTGAASTPPDAPSGDSGPTTQAKAVDSLDDALQAKQAASHRAPAPRTQPVQRLVEHFDAMKGEDS